jgi:hypothetical protein
MKNIFTNIGLTILLAVSLRGYSQAPSIAWQKSLGGSAGDLSHDIKQSSDGGYIVVGSTSSADGDVSGYKGGFTDAWVVKLNGAGAIQWQKCFGGSGLEEFRSVQQTADGGYILFGYSDSFDGDVSGNHGQFDFWLVKITNTGNIEWQKCLGGNLEEIGYGVQQTTDGGYILTGVTGSTNGDVTGNHGNPSVKDVWVVKTSAAGILEWQKNFGTTGNDQSKFIQQTADGGYIVAAGGDRLDGDLSCALHGGNDSWILKLDAIGNMLWQKCLGGPGSESPACIRENPDGTIIVVSFVNSNGGDVSGWHNPLSGFPADFWVVKLSSAGTIIWQKCLGGTAGDIPYSIQQTLDGGYIVAGFAISNDGDVSGSHGGEEFWVVKLTDAGAIEWQKCFGGTSQDDCTSIQQTSDGGFIMTGAAMSNDGDVTGNHGSWDYWVVKLGSGALPVTLLSFTAQKNTGQVKLRWQTASEQNADHFSIERSNDGRQFAAIGNVTAAGNSNSIKNYFFIDISPGSLNYYRLRQVDKDGKFAYSPVIIIANGAGELIFTLSPNPATDFIHITYPGKKESVTIAIYDTRGKLLRQQTMKNELYFKIKINQLEPGIYFIQLTDGEAIRKGKFIKQ